jgi:hypothetical protein
MGWEVGGGPQKILDQFKEAAIFSKRIQLATFLRNVGTHLPEYIMSHNMNVTSV